MIKGRHHLRLPLLVGVASRKVSSVVPAFKNVGERSTVKSYRPVSPLSLVSKVFEKLLNNGIVDHLEKYGTFCDFQYGLGLLDQLQIF